MSADSFGLSYPPGTTWPREWEICILWAFQKVSQPVGACLFLLPALLLSLSCQGGIAQKVGWGATQESDPLEKCVWGSGCFLAFLMCLPLAKASLGGGGDLRSLFLSITFPLLLPLPSSCSLWPCWGPKCLSAFCR